MRQKNSCSKFEQKWAVSLFGFISTFLVFGARLCEPQPDRTLKGQPFLNALCLVTLLLAGPGRFSVDKAMFWQRWQDWQGEGKLTGRPAEP
jgi:hypothetical protein